MRITLRCCDRAPFGPYEEEAAKHDYHAEGFFSGCLKHMARLALLVAGGTYQGPCSKGSRIALLFEDPAYEDRQFIRQIIRQLARLPCIIRVPVDNDGTVPDSSCIFPLTRPPPFEDTSAPMLDPALIDWTCKVFCDSYYEDSRHYIRDRLLNAFKLSREYLNSSNPSELQEWISGLSTDDRLAKSYTDATNWTHLAEELEQLYIQAKKHCPCVNSLIQQLESIRAQLEHIRELAKPSTTEAELRPLAKRLGELEQSLQSLKYGP